MPISIAQILAPYEHKPELLQRIAFRTVEPPIAIVEPNPEWPKRFEEVKDRIRKSLGDLIVDIFHTGSTSVPGLPAKDVIDVDLKLRDILDEAAYVQSLQDAGFRFLLREPNWHQHRFFVEDWPGAYHVNLHVWGPDSPEVARHCIFRDWLRKTPADRALYASLKREAAEQSTLAGNTMMEYTRRKDRVIQDILERAFRELGYIQ